MENRIDRPTKTMRLKRIINLCFLPCYKEMYKKATTKTSNYKRFFFVLKFYIILSFLWTTKTTRTIIFSLDIFRSRIFHCQLMICNFRFEKCSIKRWQRHKIREKKKKWRRERAKRLEVENATIHEAQINEMTETDDDFTRVVRKNSIQFKLKMHECAFRSWSIL